ncbi:MAG: DUF6164 family protein [Mariprofundaceae bacterium]|nr:DUF6164 family protein [Mariprofundaceae bacterium]
MSTLLFKLRHVPDDEAEEVRELLQTHEIDFYETTAGTWGISLPALWLHDDAQLKKAKRLIDDYQQARSKRVQSDYQQQCQKGEQRTMVTLIQESPLKFFGYVFAILFVLYLMTVPVSFLFS